MRKLILPLLLVVILLPSLHEPLLVSAEPEEGRVELLKWSYEPRYGWSLNPGWESWNVRREVLYSCRNVCGFTGLVLWHREPASTWEGVKFSTEAALLLADIVEAVVVGEVKVIEYVVQNLFEELCKEAVFKYVEENLLNEDETADIFVIAGKLDGEYVVSAWFLKDRSRVVLVSDIPYIAAAFLPPVHYKLARDAALATEVSRRILEIPLWNFKAVKVELLSETVSIGREVAVRATIYVDACTLPPNAGIRLYVGDNPYKGLLTVTSINQVAEQEGLIGPLPGQKITFTLKAEVRSRVGVGSGRPLVLEVNHGGLVPELRRDDNTAVTIVDVKDELPNKPPVVRPLRRNIVVKVGEEVNLSDFLVIYDPDRKPRGLQVWWDKVRAPWWICEFSNGLVKFRREGVCVFKVYASDGHLTDSAKISVEGRSSGVWGELFCYGKHCPADGLRIAINQKVEFKVVAEDLDGRSVTVDWDFGDGTVIRDSGEFVKVHGYGRPGQYTVKVRVKNDAFDPFNPNPKTYITFRVPVTVSSLYGGDVKPSVTLCPPSPRGGKVYTCPWNGSEPGYKYHVDVAVRNSGKESSETLEDPATFKLKLYEVRGGEARLVGERDLGFLAPYDFKVITFTWEPGEEAIYELVAVLVGTGESGEELFHSSDSVIIATTSIPVVIGVKSSPKFPMVGGKAKLSVEVESDRRIVRYEWYSFELLGGRRVDTADPYIEVPGEGVTLPYGGTYDFKVRACDELGFCSKWWSGTVTFTSEKPRFEVEVKDAYILDSNLVEVKRLDVEELPPRGYILPETLYPGEYVSINIVIRNLGGAANNVLFESWVEGTKGRRARRWVEREVMGNILGSEEGVFLADFGSMDTNDSRELRLTLKTGGSEGIRLLRFRISSSPEDPAGAEYSLEVRNAWPDLEVREIGAYDPATGAEVEIVDVGEEFEVKARIINLGPSELPASYLYRTSGDSYARIPVRLYALKVGGPLVWRLLSEKVVKVWGGLPVNTSTTTSFRARLEEKGEWLLKVEVASSLYYVDSEWSNNYAAVKLRVGGDPDLEITGFKLTPPCYDNETERVWVDVFVTNTGLKPTHEPCNASLYAGDRLIGKQVVPPLAPGETVTATWELPLNTTDIKRIRILVVVDPEDVVEELFEWNNRNGTWLTPCTPLTGEKEPEKTVIPPANEPVRNRTRAPERKIPDLTVEILGLECIDPTWESYRCHYVLLARISNIGSGDAGRFMVTVTDLYGGASDLLSSVWINGLKAGERIVLAFNLTLAEPCPPVTPHTLLVEADSTNIIEELREDNNAATIPIPS